MSKSKKKGAADDELSIYTKQLEDTENKLKLDPNNEDFLALRESLVDLLSMLKDEADQAPSTSAPVKAPSASVPSPPGEEAKWSKANHPAFQPGYKPVGQSDAPPPPPPPASKTAHVFYVNDDVKAKWVNGDKQFYQARIISITGSSADPIYTVKFKGYNDTDNIRAKDILPPSNESKKRKAEDAIDAVPPPPKGNPGVISGAAKIDPALANKAKEQETAREKAMRSNKPTRQLKGSKELSKKQNDWKSFQAKGTKAAKATKKASMFAVGEGLGSRVGFIGSGKAMSKDPTRARHVHPIAEDNVDDDDDDDD